MTSEENQLDNTYMSDFIIFTGISIEENEVQKCNGNTKENVILCRFAQLKVINFFCN